MRKYPENYHLFECRPVKGLLEVRPNGRERPVFLFSEGDLDFLWSCLFGQLDQQKTWSVVGGDAYRDDLFDEE